MPPKSPAVHALFQRRIAGDDALLKLARLRFAQAGLAAEVYADSAGELEHVLKFVPDHERLPVVHLNRNLNLLHDKDRAAVEDFATRFAGRVSGLVVHDKREMESQSDSLVAELGELDARIRRTPDAPMVFLEYAAGLPPEWFVEMAKRIVDLDRMSCCLDVGHIGIKQAGSSFGARHPDLGLGSLSPQDDRLPAVVDDVQSAVKSALPVVLDMIGAIGGLGKPLHFHLHDGHPLVAGLSDHFSFLTRLPIPFEHQGRCSLSMMYGPSGLSAIVSAAVEAGSPSFTLEIHQVEGRSPLGDAAEIFHRWTDTTNAERMNYWLSVLAENSMLIDAAVGR
jgi:hypothetical protein